MLKLQNTKGQQEVQRIKTWAQQHLWFAVWLGWVAVGILMVAAVFICTAAAALPLWAFSYIFTG